VKKTILILLLLTAISLTAQTGKTGVDAITAASAKKHLTYFSSDKMKGRDTPSPELDSSAVYIARYFQKNGLKPAGKLTDYFHYFNVSRNSLSAPNIVQIKNANVTTDFKIKKDFVPLFLTANKKITAPVVFAGYGITAPELNYDDYANIDATGKIVFIFTHEPGENDSTCVFSRLENSNHNKIDTKVMNAVKHGASGLILVTDPNHRFNRPPNVWPSLMRHAPTNGIPLSLEEKGENQIVAIRAGRLFAETIISKLGKTMSELQTDIDADLKPQSCLIPDLTVTIETNLNRNEMPVKNVLGFLKGTDPLLADEIIAIGAHYDHLGSRNDTIIYNGADDNASGTVGVMLLAKAFASKRPCRSILFCTWAGEEKGLFGSRYFVNSDPIVPLDKIVTYINLDMIGRMDSTEVRISGCNSGDIFQDLIKKSNTELKLNIIERKSVSRSDHAPFYDMGIPVLGFDTDFHADYHKPTDTIEKCSMEGIVKVCQMVFQITEELAVRKSPPVYTAVKPNNK